MKKSYWGEILIDAEQFRLSLILLGFSEDVFANNEPHTVFHLADILRVWVYPSKQSDFCCDALMAGKEYKITSYATLLSEITQWIGIHSNLQ